MAELAIWSARARGRPREAVLGMAMLKQIVVDCRHPAALARFWAAALDEFEIRDYDDAEIARLDALGFTPETDPSVILDGPNVELCFQRVDAVPTTKRPLHLDLRADDRKAEVQRLVALGAAVAERFESHTWMRDPEGNDFCVVDSWPTEPVLWGTVQ
jgi:Glyoxalase-like domain